MGLSGAPYSVKTPLLQHSAATKYTPTPPSHPPLLQAYLGLPANFHPAYDYGHYITDPSSMKLS